MLVTGTYNPYLVALSVLVACFTSYTALDLAGRIATARGSARRIWLATDHGQGKDWVIAVDDGVIRALLEP